MRCFAASFVQISTLPGRRGPKRAGLVAAAVFSLTALLPFHLMLVPFLCPPLLCCFQASSGAAPLSSPCAFFAYSFHRFFDAPFRAIAKMPNALFLQSTQKCPDRSEKMSLLVLYRAVKINQRDVKFCQSGNPCHQTLLCTACRCVGGL